MFLKKTSNLFNFIQKINIYKTIYFNFKMLPFRDAKKLPVLFYGNVLISGLHGRIIFNQPVKRGIVRIGVNNEVIKTRTRKTEIRIDGDLIINGKFDVGIDVIMIILKNAKLSVDEGTFIGSRNKIIATKEIKLGKYCRLGFESQILDTNFHFVKNLENNTVKRLNEKIFIDDYCWIGNRTTIMAGTQTPKNTIIGSNSLLNKNYSAIIPEKSFIGGIPAKLVRKNMIRIFDKKLEREISEFFESNTNVSIMNLN